MPNHEPANSHRSDRDPPDLWDKGAAEVPDKFWEHNKCGCPPANILGAHNSEEFQVHRQSSYLTAIQVCVPSEA